MTEYSLKDFGWNQTLPASEQVIAVQSALDSGEPLTFKGTITIDAPLVMEHCPSLRGFGGDLTNRALGVSQIRTGEPDIPMLTMLKSHAVVQGFGFHGDGPPGVRSGLVVGNGVDYTYAPVIDRITTNFGLHHGIHVKGVGGMVLSNSWLWGSNDAAFIENLIQVDAGDNKVTNCDFNALSGGAGLRWHSGGGLYILGCKFVNGTNHINMSWKSGGSGNFTLVGCSLEGGEHISVDIDGNQTFRRAQFTGNTWGGVLMAVAVRNFHSSAWLEQLVITGNTARVLGNNPVFDLGCVAEGVVSGNAIHGNGIASTGIHTRNPSSGTIGKNCIAGCAQTVVNEAGWG